MSNMESSVSTPDSSIESLFTVQQAAEYLQVSQPTIFRWMKQGILSFYKIGGSTRFSKDGLDTVVEKMTGMKEAEAAMGRCASCGHSILVDGELQGTGKLYFRPVRTRFWVLAEALVPTKARVCEACGYIQIHADAAKIRKLTSIGSEAEPPQPKGGEPHT